MANQKTLDPTRTVGFILFVGGKEMEYLIYADTKAKELELLVHGTKTHIILGAAAKKGNMAI